MRRNKDKISPEELLAVAPDTPGVEVKAHHCKEGKDNDRMYVTRLLDGSVVGYCHHCGSSGRVSQQGSTRSKKRRSRERTGSHFESDLRIPRDFTTDLSEWSLQSRAWVLKYGIKEDELANNHVGYSSTLGGVVFPVFNYKGELVYYQCRPCDRQPSAEDRQDKGGGEPEATRTGPKYITRCATNATRRDNILRVRKRVSSGTYLHVDHSVNGVIVEDVLSAIKVTRVEDCIGIPLMGANVSQQLAEHCGLHFENVFIFLDNDNKQVRENQRKAKKLLDPLVRGQVILLQKDRDPKSYTVGELSKILTVKPLPEEAWDDDLKNRTF